MCRLVIMIVVFFVVCSQTLFSGTMHNARQGVVRKTLPLDGVPNVVLKTRENSEYLPNRVIVKLMPGVDQGALDDVLVSLSATSVTPMFPVEIAQRQRGDVDLSRFYVVTYTSPIDPFVAAEELLVLSQVQYAEPWFIYPVNSDPLFTPNDPSFSLQYGLTKIQAPAAWDITQGDTSVVIGIVDTGVELGHPDLSANIWRNRGEMGLDGLGRDKRTNGVDDDGNGYIDDWQGWDFGGADYNNVVQDNNPVPTAGNNAHGTHVAGIASAVTNNSTGVAGTGFKCRLLAVKTTADNDTRGPGGSAYIIAGFQGIAYAALMHATVMNCSWGGTGGSQFEQDIINYATQQGTLVVAAAGNENTNTGHYPSDYANVISVAATNSSDVRASFSNFGSGVDVCAPGVSIYSTIFPSTYTYLDGTSMSSPFTAGAVALVKSAFPSHNALQLGEKVRVTCDNIDGINPSYAGQLGKGRINILRALTVNSPALRARTFTLRDSLGGNNNGIPEPNETIDLYFTFINYLAPTANASVTLSTTASGLTVLNGTYQVGVLATLDTVRNTAAPFRIRLSSTVAPGLIASLKLTMTDGTYNDVQWFSLVVNPTYQTHNVNQATATMTNNGRIGFNDFPTNTQGVGFIYPTGGVNELFEGGLIIGTSSTKLVDNVREPNGAQDNDFLGRAIYQMVSPGVISNQDGRTSFSDSLAPAANLIGLRVNQYTYAYSAPEHDDYIIVRYDVKNLTAAPISNIYVGQFFDWDIGNYNANQTSYDASRSLAYAWDNSSTTVPYFGVRALDTASSCRGLLNTVSIVLDRAAKWSWISGGTLQASVGPGDIHFVIASKPFSLSAGSTRLLGFAIIGGANLPALQTNAGAAASKWVEIRNLVSVKEEPNIPLTFTLEQNYPNPFNPTTTITFSLPLSGTNQAKGRVGEGSHVSLKVYDVLGREVATLVDGVREPGLYTVPFDASNFSSGVYLYRLIAGSFVETKKMVVTK